MKLLLLAVIGLAYPILSLAIQCYVCNHSDLPNANLIGIPNDNDCKRSHDKYLRECSASDIRSETDRSMFKTFTDNWKADTSFANEQRQSNYSCGIATQKTNNYTTILRVCVEYQSDKCETEPAINGTAAYCICNTDKCNNSNTVSSSVAAVLFTTFLVVMSNVF